ncbi:MAG: inorganic phosphate transporter [bacterium]|nr:inorganic phosphate transporter [bacterium]
MFKYYEVKWGGRGVFSQGAILELSFVTVLPEILHNPILLIILLLSIGIILINGATDAPNAIAAAVGARSISPGKAIVMASICNFLGVTLMTFVSTAVAHTIMNMVDFGGDSHLALIALFAAMISIIVWSVGNWLFGISVSQSHCMIAGLTGASIALIGGFDAVNWHEWLKVIYGLLASVGMGFGFGWLFSKLIVLICRDMVYRKTLNTFGRLQIMTSALTAFMHGAQDGQKFMSVCLLGIVFAMGGTDTEIVKFPFWVMLVCSLCLCVGTAIGGKRIIKKIGINMVHMEKWQGFSASLSSFLGTFIATISGLPISTTHVATTAIMGVGSAKRVSSVKWETARDLFVIWILTFPGCGLIAFGLAKLFMIVLI